MSLVLSLLWLALWLGLAKWLQGRKQLMAVLDPQTMKGDLVWRRPATEHELKLQGQKPLQVGLDGAFRYHGPGAGLWIVDANNGDQLRIPPKPIRHGDKTWTERARTDAHHYWKLCQQSLDELLEAVDAKWTAMQRAVPWIVIGILGVTLMILFLVWRMLGDA